MSKKVWILLAIFFISCSRKDQDMGQDGGNKDGETSSDEEREGTDTLSDETTSQESEEETDSQAESESDSADAPSPESDEDSESGGDSENDSASPEESDEDNNSDSDGSGDSDSDDDAETDETDETDETSDTGDTETDQNDDTGGESDTEDGQGDAGVDSDDGDASDTGSDDPGYCTYTSEGHVADFQAAYELWYDTVVTEEGAGGYLRIRKPDSGSIIDSTVSEGIGYGMIIAVYMDDQNLFDNLWKYEQLHLNDNGLMHWEVDPDGNVIGTGAATDGDEDMAWALIMADKKWGGQGSLNDTYLNIAIELIDLIWLYEVDHNRDYMLKAGDSWGDADVTNPSYFAPAYYKVFAAVTGNQDWHLVVDSSYDIINKSLNAEQGNSENGLVPAWCDSDGNPTEAYGGAPLYFQHDSTRTPFRVGQDYCYFGEPRAKAYMEKITSFYKDVGIANIGDGYDLDGTPHPLRTQDGGQAASFVGPAGVGAMSDLQNLGFINEAYQAIATMELTAGTIYYEKCWAVLSLLMMDGKLVDLTGTEPTL